MKHSFNIEHIKTDERSEQLLSELNDLTKEELVDTIYSFWMMSRSHAESIIECQKTCHRDMPLYYDVTGGAIMTKVNLLRHMVSTIHDKTNTYKVKYLKTGNVYRVIDDCVKNCTNSVDGQRMVLYERDGHKHVRRYTEFFEKFVKISWHFLQNC